ncbi:MAG: hypothetical protein ABIK62_03775 [candidate division WOR-3 bacterium]
MNIVRIGEPVRVQVTFEPVFVRRNENEFAFPHHKIKPRAFIWQNREYQVSEITYVWRELIGEVFVYHFAVTEGDNVFELCFNTSTMDWTLVSVACA